MRAPPANCSLFECRDDGTAEGGAEEFGRDCNLGDREQSITPTAPVDVACVLAVDACDQALIGVDVSRESGFR